MNVRRAAHALGLRFRLHRKELPGSPDIAFPCQKLVLFVHGCFWHQHPDRKRAGIRQSRQEYWSAKLSKNIERDRAASLRKLVGTSKSSGNLRRKTMPSWRFACKGSFVGLETSRPSEEVCVKAVFDTRPVSIYDDDFAHHFHSPCHVLASLPLLTIDQELLEVLGEEQ